MFGDYVVSKSLMTKGGCSLDFLCSQTILMGLQGRAGPVSLVAGHVSVFLTSVVIMNSQTAYCFLTSLVKSVAV